jgi:hypothetical protein
VPKRTADEERWCADRRKQVRAYLKHVRLKHGRIGTWPAWHVEPYLSLWAIESAARRGCVGWWTLCGDLPTDYLSARRAKHPRTALRAFAKRWLVVARYMESGRAHPSIRIGERADWPQLAPLLRDRAKLFAKFARTKSIWQ